MASSNVDGVLQLLKKLDKGDLTGAKEVLKKKVINVNLADVGGNTPLIVAARKGYNDIIDDLLTCENIDVNLANKNGRTPLFEAAEKGRKEIVRKLLSSPGIEVDKCNERGSTPMIVAARNGFTDIVQDLFDKGANVDLADKTESKSTPLIEAAKNGRIETVRKLVLELGATLSKTDARGDNAIVRATRSSQSNQETIRFLKEQEQFLSNPQAPPVFEDLQRTPAIPQTDHSNGSASTGHGSGYMLLQTSPKHPKVVFCDESQEKVFSQDGGYFDFDNGIEVTVPPHTGPGSSKVVIKSRPGFVVKKNCVLPQGVLPASPSYFVSSEESEGSKRNGNYVITIEHHADEEVQKLVILQADSNPEKYGLDYVYKYKTVPKSNTEFLLGENKGKLTTSHINEPGKIFSVGVNCEAESGKKESECSASNNLYMVQIYRSPRQAEKKIAVVFVSLYGKAFLKSLRKKEEQWTTYYPGISTKPADTTTMSGLKFVENNLTLTYNEVEGWLVHCDKTKISQGEVDAPKISNKDYDLENPGYPPKILCEFIPKENAQAKSCSFFCTGLKGNPDFHVLLEPPKAKDGSIQTQVTSDVRNSTGVSKLHHSQVLPCTDDSSKLEVTSDGENQHLSVQVQPCTGIPSELKEVMKEVKSTAANLSTDTDSSLVKSLKSLTDQISIAFQSSSLDDLAIQLSSIKSEVKALLRTLQKNPRYSDVIMKQLLEIEFRSSTLHQATKAKIMHCISQIHIEDALKELADRGEELLMAVKKVILEVLASDRADIKNADGKTAMDLARQWKYDDIVKFIDNYNSLPRDFKHEGDKNVNKEETLSKSVDGITPVPVLHKSSADFSDQDKEIKDTFSTSSEYPLCQNTAQPEITFYDEPKEETFTSSGGHADFNNGVEVTVPPHAVPQGSIVKVKVQPGFAPSDVFIMPEGIQSASPSYLISSDCSDGLNGEVTLTMEHHVKVSTEEELLFLAADSHPKQSSSRSESVYEYQEVSEAKTEFPPGENKGKLFLISLGEMFFKVGKTIAKKLIGGSKHSVDHNLYTLRLYQTPPETSGDRLCVVVVSLLQRLYLKILSKFEDNIQHLYPALSKDTVVITVNQPLSFVQQYVSLKVAYISNWRVVLDQSEISKSSVDLPITCSFKPKDLQIHTYPPRVICRIFPEQGAVSTTCTLAVHGFDKPVNMNMVLQTSTPQMNTIKLQVEAEILKNFASKITNRQLGETVKNIVAVTTLLTSALRSSSLGDMNEHIDSIETQIKTVLEVSKKVAEDCTRKAISKSIEDKLSKVKVLSHQLCRVTKVKLKFCRDQSEKIAALEDLVNGGVNLLQTVNGLLEDIRTLGDIDIDSTEQLLLAEVEEATKEVCSDWYSLAVELGISHGVRKAIERDHPTVEARFHDMLRQWVKRRASPPPSLSALIRALRSTVINRGDVAKELETTLEETGPTVGDDGSSTHLEPFDPQNPLSVDKHLKTVREATWDVRARWYDLGIELGTKVGTLEVIKQNFQNESNLCYTSLLEHWLTQTEPQGPTWADLIAALQSPSIECGDLVSKVEALIKRESRRETI